ncbi:23S rRNA (guanosine(2251)-2'-O)-methyltransferase RlmB [Campylobacter sp. FMV-PI01]|uniref:23S rRNA (Guanosine(2251)-2'-O)-methyltransferase RlmB n=1 Tax=Campylobacter portucalensis TaxID=2608384 RepID=A0A6L5WFQ5_9BACT|nr:23S rRNA (guanosine(2251)-2'-O)-methyltransferase RlmB [Campylobacter portucalensis]MSN95699.1 23S rRNA (guanosine(2251)-2'-O)-methyltransferase RlmB [Campylobacter portucalensis]
MIIYGKQLFLYLLKKHRDKFIKIYLAKECEKPLFKEILKTGVEVIRLDFKKAQALAKGGNHQGFLAEILPFEFADFKTLKNEKSLVILYGLSDVGNIGAIIRTAYALGVGGIVVVSKSLAIEGVLRASSGAMFDMKVALYSDGLALLNELKQSGFEIYGTSLKGVDIKSAKFGNKKALIMGSEGSGMPKKALEKCDKLLTIKMKNNWDSLNVSAAFAIICDRMLDE